MHHDVHNIMLILSSPSGAGKTTLTKKIQQKYHSFKISVSHTTRKPRPNEVDGVDYNFISIEKFKELIDQGKFYEYAKIFDNYYGTLKENVDDLFKTNDIIVVPKQTWHQITCVGDSPGVRYAVTRPDVLHRYKDA